MTESPPWWNCRLSWNLPWILFWTVLHSATKSILSSAKVFLCVALESSSPRVWFVQLFTQSTRRRSCGLPRPARVDSATISICVSCEEDQTFIENIPINIEPSLEILVENIKDLLLRFSRTDIVCLRTASERRGLVVAVVPLVRVCGGSANAMVESFTLASDYSQFTLQLRDSSSRWNNPTQRLCFSESNSVFQLESNSVFQLVCMQALSVVAPSAAEAFIRLGFFPNRHAPLSPNTFLVQWLRRCIRLLLFPNAVRGELYSRLGVISRDAVTANNNDVPSGYKH